MIGRIEGINNDFGGSDGNAVDKIILRQSIMFHKIKGLVGIPSLF